MAKFTQPAQKKSLCSACRGIRNPHITGHEPGHEADTLASVGHSGHDTPPQRTFSYTGQYEGAAGSPPLPAPHPRAETDVNTVPDHLHATRVPPGKMDLPRHPRSARAPAPTRSCPARAESKNRTAFRRCGTCGGPSWVRTSDLSGVNGTLFH